MPPPFNYYWALPRFKLPGLTTVAVTRDCDSWLGARPPAPDYWYLRESDHAPPSQRSRRVRSRGPDRLSVIDRISIKGEREKVSCLNLTHWWPRPAYRHWPAALARPGRHCHCRLDESLAELESLASSLSHGHCHHASDPASESTIVGRSWARPTVGRTLRLPGPACGPCLRDADPGLSRSRPGSLRWMPPG